MLAYVPVTFDTYRPIPRHLHWTLQHLVAHIGKGWCFASTRSLARIAGCSKSTIARHLAALVAGGYVRRRRRSGGCYEYTVAERFLPAARGVSHSREKGVPPLRTEEKVDKKTWRFAIAKGDAGCPRPTDWAPRLKGWRKSGFWLDGWGPRPGEAGCFAPLTG